METNNDKVSEVKKRSNKSLGTQLKEKRVHSAHMNSQVGGSGENVNNEKRDRSAHMNSPVRGSGENVNKEFRKNKDKNHGSVRSGGKVKSSKVSGGKVKSSKVSGGKSKSSGGSKNKVKGPGASGVGSKRVGEQDADVGAVGSSENGRPKPSRKAEFKRYTEKLYKKRRDRLVARSYRFSRKWRVSVILLLGVRDSTDVLVSGVGFLLGYIRDNHPHHVTYKPPYEDKDYKLTRKVVENVLLSESIEPVEQRKKKEKNPKKQQNLEKEPCVGEKLCENEDSAADDDAPADIDTPADDDVPPEDDTPTSAANEDSAMTDERDNEDSSWTIQSLDVFSSNDWHWKDENRLKNVLRGLISYIQNQVSIDEGRDKINVMFENLIGLDESPLYPLVLETLWNFVSFHKERSCNLQKILPHLLSRVNSGVRSEIKKEIINNLEQIKSTFSKSYQLNIVLSLLIEHPRNYDLPTYVKIPCLEYIRGLVKSSEDLLVNENSENSFIEIISYLDDLDEKMKKSTQETIWTMFNCSSKQVRESLLKTPEPYKAKMLESVGLSRCSAGLKGGRPASTAEPSSCGDLSGIHGLQPKKGKLSRNSKRTKENQFGQKFPRPGTIQHKLDVKNLSSNIL